MASPVSSSSHHEGNQIVGIDSTLIMKALLEESPQTVEDAVEDERLQCIIQSFEAEIINYQPKMITDHNRKLDVLVKGNWEDAGVPQQPPPPPPPQDHFELKDLYHDDYVSASHDSLPTTIHEFDWFADDMEIMNSSSFPGTDHVLGCGGGVMENFYEVSLEEQPYCSLWQESYDPMACN